jgi:hypothetical protein
MFEHPERYLSHLLSLSLLLTTAAQADAAKKSNIQVLVGKGIKIERLHFWPYEAFPDATFVKIFIPPFGVKQKPVAQIYVPDSLVHGGPMKGRVEVLRGTPPPEPAGD